jgi:hypothetical protein
MAKFTVKCDVDGKEIARYEFDCTSVSKPQKLASGPITIYFDPTKDVHHQMEINSLPPGRSATIKGGNAATASN